MWDCNNSQIIDIHRYSFHGLINSHLRSSAWGKQKIMPPERRHSNRSVPATPKDWQAREYSCVSCKKRKTRCDRQSPCSKCLEMGIKCVPGVRAPYSRRKRSQSDGRGTSTTLPRLGNGAQTAIPNFGQWVLFSQSDLSSMLVRRRRRIPLNSDRNLWHGLSDEVW